MHELRLVGVHEDGENLILVGRGDERFLLPVDDSLRAAVRRDRARLGQLQLEQDGGLRPRDIQARIRAGQTAEEIAEAAGVPVDHVRRYEGPVLAEREFMSRQARAVRIRRPGISVSASPTLGDLVTERLASREVDEGEAIWDAWRGEDGTWQVSLCFVAGTRERVASWRYDPQLRHVTAQDDEARWFTEDQPAATSLAPRRLVPIRNHDAPARPEPDPLPMAAWSQSPVGSWGDEPLPDGPSIWQDDDLPAAPALPPGPAGPPGPVATPTPAAAGEATVDLLDSLRERRGRRQRPAPADLEVDSFETTPYDPVVPIEAPNASSLPTGLERRSRNEDRRARPRQGHPAGQGQPAVPPISIVDSKVETKPEPRIEARAENRAETRAETRAPARAETRAETRVPARAETRPEPPAARMSPRIDPPSQVELPKDPEPVVPAGRRSKRASVPSWDDIVFGSRRD